MDGEDGYLKYKGLKPDLVTMDITMPKLDGIEALQLMKKANPDAKVIMITAAGQKEKMIQAIRYGAAEFISKPYETEDVMKILDKVLQA